MPLVAGRDQAQGQPSPRKERDITNDSRIQEMNVTQRIPQRIEAFTPWIMKMIMMIPPLIPSQRVELCITYKAAARKHEGFSR